MGRDFFRVVDHPNKVPMSQEYKAYLVNDEWDDFGFKTLFQLFVFDSDENKHEIGYVKVGQFDLGDSGWVKFDSEFEELDEEYFSLGKDVEYYEKLSELQTDLKKKIVKGLNDLVEYDDLRSKALQEEVTRTSLLRGVSETQIKGQFRRVLEGGAILTDYNFGFEIPSNESMAELDLKFSVDPEYHPPTNIHVLIGKNGVGKTFILNEMTKAFLEKETEEEIFSECNFYQSQKEDDSEDILFANLILATFNIFDPLKTYQTSDEITKFDFIGLERSKKEDKNLEVKLNPEKLTNDFVQSLDVCLKMKKHDEWLKAFKSLESDSLFREMPFDEIVNELSGEDLREKAGEIFKFKMGSGHRSVLLTITKLVEKVEEKTLVLMDEPETHLHPPLLSAFVRAFSELLTYKNGVAIIATHSPVILQEVPQTCAWKLRRTGMQVNAERPDIETFGENVGVLIREVFGLEVTEAGYHSLLQDSLGKFDSFWEIEEYFNGHLGMEARVILRGSLAEDKD